MRAILAALIVCLFAVPSWAQKPKVLLVLTYVMPEREPDIRRTFNEDSIEQCWTDAKEFVAHGIPKQLREEAVAVMAGCLVPKQQEDDL